MFWWSVGGIVLILALGYNRFVPNLIYRPKPIKQFQNKHVIITGGSAGLGKQLAIQFSRLGASVTIIARDEKK